MRYLTRIRTVKNELFHHEAIFDKEEKTGLPLRIAFISLLTICDREGRFVWSPRSIKTHCLPFDSHDINAILTALIEIGLIAKYTNDDSLNKDDESLNNEYGVVIKFTKHQAINIKEQGSKLPKMEGLEILQGNEYEAYRTEKEKRNKEKSTGEQRVNNGKLSKQGTRNKEQEQELIINTSKEVDEIFNFYLFIFDKLNISRLTNNRINLINESLKYYSVDQIKLVILGYSQDKWWQGENPNKSKFDDINFFLNKPENIERFLINLGKLQTEYSQTELDNILLYEELKSDFEGWKAKNKADFKALEAFK